MYLSELSTTDPHSQSRWCTLHSRHWEIYNILIIRSKNL
jgi:hypothetical protein